MYIKVTFNRLLITLFACVFGATACLPNSATLPAMPNAELAVETAVPVIEQSETLQPLSASRPIPPTLFPTLTIPDGPTPEAYGLPDWLVLEPALLEAAKLGDGKKGRCEWEVLGHEPGLNKVYVWAVCESWLYDGIKSAIAVPAAIYMKADGSIERIYMPVFYGDEEFNREFPEWIQKEFSYESHRYDYLANLALREKFPNFPPQAAVAEGKYPSKPLTTLAPDEAKTKRWIAYQSALAKVWYGTDEDIFCEWDYLGQLDGFVYLQPDCEPLDRQQREFWMPYCRLKIEQDGEISEVICKEKEQFGGSLGLDPQIFPQQIRERSWQDSTDTTRIKEHIELRRWFQDMLPLVVELGLELP